MMLNSSLLPEAISFPALQSLSSILGKSNIEHAMLTFFGLMG